MSTLTTQSRLLPRTRRSSIELSWRADAVCSPAAVCLTVAETEHVPHNLAEVIICQSATMSSVRDHSVTLANSTQAHQAAFVYHRGHGWCRTTSECLPARHRAGLTFPVIVIFLTHPCLQSCKLDPPDCHQ